VILKVKKFKNRLIFNKVIGV